MTKDFRNVGRLPESVQATAPMPSATTAPSTAPNQRIILLAIYASAVGFLLGGLWLLSGRSSPLPAEITPILGLAFVISAIADIVIAAILKRFWAKQARR